MVEYEIVSSLKKLAKRKKEMRSRDKLLLKACQSLSPVFDYLKAAQERIGPLYFRAGRQF